MSCSTDTECVYCRLQVDRSSIWCMFKVLNRAEQSNQLMHDCLQIGI